jgi:predicted RNA-binding Zn-ribbon protein involved in translation (DUF1610 family)
MSDTRNTSQPVCPNCGHVERDAWEINFGPGIEGDAEVTCNACGEDYHCERDAIITYTTRKKDPTHG